LHIETYCFPPELNAAIAHFIQGNGIGRKAAWVGGAAHERMVQCSRSKCSKKRQIETIGKDTAGTYKVTQLHPHTVKFERSFSFLVA
jgi:hypothetical protein